MSHYRPNVRDLEFNLFEVLGRDRAYGTGAFADTDPETARGILAEVARLAEHELAPSADEADRTPPVYDPQDRTVTVPHGFAKAYHLWVDAGWHLLDVPRALGGAEVPPSLRWACAELVLGANPALYMYQTGPGFARVLDGLGTAEQRQLARSMVRRHWGATMVLTEPDAGSDVGACRTRAVRQEDGTWHITGVKRFITSGEHDLAENIVHVVLARPEGHGPGTKGLSVFLVPKFQVTNWSTGELGARNGVYATALEDKTGLKASATCELTFGAEHPAVGVLLGDAHDGIRQMFQIIEQARMIVGTKAAATLSTAYRTAAAYARERVQGRSLDALGDRAAPAVPIIEHAEVRRALLTQKAYAEGLRALVLYTAVLQDRIAAADATGDATGGDVAADRARNDLLLPVVKGYGSERACAQLMEALQTVGGAGYTRDLPFERYIRDAKVDTLYEGTTAIQAQDFFFRKIARDRAGALTSLLAEIEEAATTAATATEAQDGPDDARDGSADGTVYDLAPAWRLLAGAVAEIRAMTDHLTGRVVAALTTPALIHQAGRSLTRYLMCCGDVVVAWLLLRQAAVAADRLAADPPDPDFYRSKMATAAFFAAEALPLIAAHRAIVEQDDPVLMDLPSAAF